MNQLSLKAQDIYQQLEPTAAQRTSSTKHKPEIKEMEPEPVFTVYKRFLNIYQLFKLICITTLQHTQYAHPFCLPGSQLVQVFVWNQLRANFGQVLNHIITDETCSFVLRGTRRGNTGNNFNFHLNNRIIVQVISPPSPLHPHGT